MCSSHFNNIIKHSAKECGRSVFYVIIFYKESIDIILVSNGAFRFKINTLKGGRGYFGFRSWKISLSV